LKHFFKIVKNKKKKVKSKQTKKEKFIQDKLPLLKELITENLLSMKKAAKIVGLDRKTATLHYKAFVREGDDYLVSFKKRKPSDESKIIIKKIESYLVIHRGFISRRTIKAKLMQEHSLDVPESSVQKFISKDLKYSKKKVVTSNPNVLDDENIVH